MIVVTGTKRSGTSMWMQILVAAGLPFIGERFPRDWAQRHAVANPHGYFESQLMGGIYYRSNPNPQTGAYLFPDATRLHAVKVFAPGLVRSDVAFIDRCIATVRPWREYVASMARLDASFGKPSIGAGSGLSPVLTWWVENYALIRDIATRRYPAHVVSYAAVLADPERHVREVLGWIGIGDPEPAIAAVESAARPVVAGPDPAEDPDVEPAHLAVFDELYDAIHSGRPLDDALIAALNQVHHELMPRLAKAEYDELVASLPPWARHDDPATSPA